MDNLDTTQTTQIVADENGPGPMTISTKAPPPAPEVNPQIQNFANPAKEEQEALNIAITVLPKAGGVVKGIEVMNAILHSVEQLGANITNLTIIKKDKK